MLVNVLLVVAFCGGRLYAETGLDAWLRYAPLTTQTARKYETLRAVTIAPGGSPVRQSAERELIYGLENMLGRKLRVVHGTPVEPGVIVADIAQLAALGVPEESASDISGDGFLLANATVSGKRYTVVTAKTDRGILYGVFALLSKIARGENIEGEDEVQQPSAPVRWVNQWDNLDGSIERGYGGASIFFEHGVVRKDLTRAAQYARLLASVGINGCTVNNVNADPRILSSDFIPQLARIADALRPWGVRLSIAVPLNSPKSIGGLDTFDPLDPRVAAWWREKVNEIYRQIPDFAGMVVKADSEGMAGPATYGRSPADAANVIARALKQHGGLVFYRAFVYNHHLDWREPHNDRAKAAYDIFHPLDGRFDDNVIIQIKNGPIDFQVREPVSPLFAGLQQTNEAVELQITQEYTGQQRHLCFLAPMWKEALDLDFRLRGKRSRLSDIVAGHTFGRETGGYVGVANVGMDATWMGSTLAMANVYAFGRLAWNPQLTAKEIADEWTRLTFGNAPEVVETIPEMLLPSWHNYENYTGPLGMGTLTDILGSHYGPGPESSERNGWGQWHRADRQGVGMDRTMATGTGFIGQYPAEVQKLYEALAACPDELLLFFHHVPYTYRLHSGRTVIQHVYDAHYEGAAVAAEYVGQWERLKPEIDEERYRMVLEQLQYQAGHAVVWRDAICDWFYRMSGIPDAKGRVGNHAGRIEAEAMQLDGYVAIQVTPWESASGGKAVSCPANHCVAAFQFAGNAGKYQLDVEYFDQNNGASKLELYVAGKLADRWTADAKLPGSKPNGDTSIRKELRGLTLRPGDEIRVVGMPEGGERAPLDYIEITPAH